MSCTISRDQTPAAISSRGLPPGGLQLVVVDQRVERGMHPHSVAMGIFHHTGDLAGAITCRITGSELRPADIDGIGTVVHGGDGRLEILWAGASSSTDFNALFFAKLTKSATNADL